MSDTRQSAREDALKRARMLRESVFQLLKREALTADECATRLGETVLTIRPRVSELNKAGRIVDSGKRRTNVSGKRATVWTAQGQLTFL